MVSPLLCHSPTLSASEFSALMESSGCLEDSPHLAVAVSGGTDSMALTLLCKQWCDAHSGTLTALTVDHGLREAAEEEAKQVHHWLTERGITHHTLTHKTDKKPQANIQDYARNVRYGLLTDYCKKAGITYLLVAHNLEDQAETFLLRLARGSGVDGLSAMRPVTQMHGITLLRPLLTVSRKTLQQTLRAQGQAWIEDPSNSNTRFARNALRDLLAVGTDVSNDTLIARLAETAHTMARARDCLEQGTQEHLAGCVTLFPEGYCTLNLPYFQSLHEEYALRILSHILMVTGRKTQKPRFEKLQHLHTMLRSSDVFKGATLCGCELYPNKDGNIMVIREAASIGPDMPITPEKSILWDNRFKIKLQHDTLSTSCNRLAIGTLSSQQILSMKKDFPPYPFPKKLLRTLPALKSINKSGLETILAIPHINYYRDGATESTLACFFRSGSPLLIAL